MTKFQSIQGNLISTSGTSQKVKSLDYKLKQLEYNNKVAQTTDATFKFSVVHQRVKQTKQNVHGRHQEALMNAITLKSISFSIQIINIMENTCLFEVEVSQSK